MEILDEYWNRSDYVLGGGTALAARWGHRPGTDVDLFIENEDYLKVVGNRMDQIRSRLEHLKTQGEIQKFTCGRDAITIQFEVGMDMSFVATEPLTPAPLVEEFEKETGVRLESTAEILAKKIFVRMNWMGNFLTRDLYDIVVAKYLDPQATESALQTISVDERVRIARMMEHDIQTNSVDQGQIIKSKYRRIEKNVWSLGVDLFSDRRLSLKNPLEVDDFGYG